MNYREMSRLAQDPASVRAAARRVRQALGERITENEQKFLADLEGFEGRQPLSMRRREYLDSLLQRTTRRASMHGFRAAPLIEKLWELRHDLNEEDEEFLESMHKRGSHVEPSIRQWKYIFSLCHRVQIVESYLEIN